MRVSTTKSKNAESFYITKSYINANGKSTSKIIRKLGALKELSEMLGTNRDGVMKWAKEQAKIETEKYKKRAFIVTQSIKKLPAQERGRALDKTGFRRMSDGKPVDITKLSEEDKDDLFYKEEPYTTKKLYQRLLITYSPKYDAYQKSIREKQIERAQKMVANGKSKKERCNPNDPARFVAKRYLLKYNQ